MNKTTRFFFSPSRDRITWRTPSEPLDPVDGDDDWRPLVVIDPEDREQAIGLTEAFYAAETSPTADPHNYGQMQAALRSLVEPPSPPEPTGLGAVVEAANGDLYVRDKTTTTVAHWKRAQGAEGGKRHRYDGLRVVRVLSEGVPS